MVTKIPSSRYCLLQYFYRTPGRPATDPPGQLLSDPVRKNTFRFPTRYEEPLVLVPAIQVPAESREHRSRERIRSKDEGFMNDRQYPDQQPTLPETI